MGKKQHSKDRMYLTTKEWKEEWGGFKDKALAPFKRLPYDRCAIAFTPFEEPACTDDGTVYDITNIVPYVMKFKRHPVSGEPLQLKDITRLHFHKNTDGEYCCPVTGKVFTEHTHIAAVKPTGNVYAYEALEELCIKPKNWRDLLTDEPFTRKDIIHIQDPLNLSGRTIDNFDHVKRQLAVSDDEGENGGPGTNDSVIRNATDDMKRALSALQTQEAKDAFASGGGGKRAEAARLLAEAKLKASGNAAANSQQQQQAAAAAAAGAAAAAAAPSGRASGPSAAAGAASASASGGGDWRLRGPDRSAEMPKFKPGAVTWDTDDHIKEAAAAGSGPRGKGGKGKAAGAAGGDTSTSYSATNGTKRSPQEWYDSAGRVKWVQGASTTGAASRAFTSTAAAIETRNIRTAVRFERNPTKKGYVRLHTSHGDLNIELHCDITPRTCENFLALCEMGYYDDVPFHRSIKNFMIQGGDPTGSGKGGESIYGPSFKDELDSRLVHAGRGVLSMANSGPNTNGSQHGRCHELTHRTEEQYANSFNDSALDHFDSCRHLDFKHTVFGRVVGGLEVLTAMEKVPTDEDDRPLQPVSIKGATIFTDPFKEMIEEEAKVAEAERKRQAREELLPSDPANKVGTWFSNPRGAEAAAPSEPVRGGVGKYLSAALLGPSAVGGGVGAGSSKPQQPAPAAAAVGSTAAVAAAAAGDEQDEPPTKKAKATGGFGNFDGW